MEQEFTSLRFEVDGHVATITLARPESLNSFDEIAHHEMLEVIGRVRDNRDIRAAVFASSGKAFSAGGDFAWMKQSHADPHSFTAFADVGVRLVGAMLDLPIPIVAAVQGDAIGLGATTVLLCDAVVAYRKARLIDPHVTVGLAAGDGGALVWPLAVGMLRARRHLLTGDPVRAEDGYAMGLVTDLVDTPEEALPVATALANRIAALPPLAVQGTKRALNRVSQQRAGEVLELGMAYETSCCFTDDFLEAVTALEGRRAGVFRGR